MRIGLLSEPLNQLTLSTGPICIKTKNPKDKNNSDQQESRHKSTYVGNTYINSL